MADHYDTARIDSPLHSEIPPMARSIPYIPLDCSQHPGKQRGMAREAIIDSIEIDQSMDQTNV